MRGLRKEAATDASEVQHTDRPADAVPRTLPDRWRTTVADVGPFRLAAPAAQTRSGTGSRSVMGSSTSATS